MPSATDEPRTPGVSGESEKRDQAACDPLVPGERVSLLEECRTSGRLTATAQGPLGVRATWEMDADLRQSASSVLRDYEDRGDVTLAFSGYLDFFQHVWGCAVQSDSGWVEVVFADERGYLDDEGQEGEDAGCTLTLVRLGQEALEEQGVGL